MLLSALVNRYEELVREGVLDKLGWGKAKISYVAVLNDEGQMEDLVSIKVSREQGPKVIQAPDKVTAPAACKRGVNIKANFLWDNCKYSFGLGEEPEKALERFKAFRDLHHEILNGVDTPAAKAMLRFLDAWKPVPVEEFPYQGEILEDLINGANVLFARKGEGYLTLDPVIQDAWDAYYAKQLADGPEGICSVTGKRGPIARIHPPIMGLAGGQSSGSALVSFNEDAYCHYGKTQGFNASIGTYAAFAYTAALNYMLADWEHLYRIGDTTILFWAKHGKNTYSDSFRNVLFGGGKDEKGNALPIKMPGQNDMDMQEEFFILGLAPNAARIVVRFFYHNSFGNILKNIHAHNERLRVYAANQDNSEEVIPLYRILSNTVRADSKDLAATPRLPGEMVQAILTNGRYPQALVANMAYRIRRERDISPIRAGILRAFYLQNGHPQIPKEVLTMALNTECKDTAYLLGRLFSVYEGLQRNAIPGIKATIADRYFSGASANPARVFPVLGNMAATYLSKLNNRNPGLGTTYSKMIAEIMGDLPIALPARLTLAQQSAFQLGYYHENQARYTKKNNNNNSEEEI